jgi:hypothetical protein
MPPGKSPRRRTAVGSLAALGLTCALLPAPAAAVARRPSTGDLSPRLAELAKPAVRSAPPARQAKELSLAPEGPGSLLRKGNRVLVEVRFDHGAVAAVNDLRATGAKIVNVSSRYQTVTVAANPTDLRELSGVPRVTGASEILTPMTAASSVCPSGVAVSEGDAQLHAAEARTAFEVDGSGVTVGVLSDSFNQAEFADTHETEDVNSGDLPGSGNTCPGQATPVDTALDNYEPGPEEPAGEDEGRAMAQIVHDLAPGAQISFATAFTGLTAFAGNVEALAAGGAQVIADDVSYFEEPFFQEGPVGIAVSNVTAGGVNYFSSAGNNNLIGGGRDIASWEAPLFRLATECPAGLSAKLEYVNQCMDFNPDSGESDPTFGITVSKGADLSLDLQWAEPWNGVETDLDAYLLDKNGNPIPEEGGGVVSSEFANVAKAPHQPFEFLFWENNTGAQQKVQVVINRYTGSGGGGSASPRLKLALLENGGGVTSTEYPESSGGDVVGPTIFGHNGAEDAMSVGAIRYNATEAPETFSSRGPVTHYFEPADGVTAAAPLVTPKEISKPDVVATDGGADTFFGSCVSNTWRFFGTSAAAPHAAAVAALERQAVPGATAAEVKQAQLETAGPVGAFSPGPAIGAGIVNAAAAIAKLKSEPFSEPILKITAPAPLNCELPELPAFEETKEEIEAANPPAEAPPPVAKPRPRTFFLLRPPKVIRTPSLKATAVFRFGASESGVTFLCRVDSAPFRKCNRRFVRRLGLGAHVLRVVARDAAGNTDPTPAVYRFRVKRVGA